jgi:hypothetical protein
MLERWYFVDPAGKLLAARYIWHMNQSTRTAGLSPAWTISLRGGLVAVLAAVLDHTAIAEVVGGGMIIIVAFLLGRSLTWRVAVEIDPGWELVWNVLLILVIVLALVGVGVMAAAIPKSP